MEEYEEECPLCGGSGLILQVSGDGGWHHEFYVNCDFCEGEGIIDWITRIMKNIDDYL